MCHFNWLTDRPEVPAINSIETAVSRCNITLKWTKPPSNGCPILFYTVHYRQRGPRHDEWNTINVTDPKVEQQELPLNCTTSYDFEVKAWNALGSSGSPPKAWAITTGGGHQQRDAGETLRLGINLITSPNLVCFCFNSSPLRPQDQELSPGKRPVRIKLKPSKFGTWTDFIGLNIFKSRHLFCQGRVTCDVTLFLIMKVANV